MRRRKLGIVRDYKAARGCLDCEEKDAVCLDLHHRDPSEKDVRLKSRRARTGNGYIAIRSITDLGYDDIDRELKKCDVVCANCHRKRHFAQA